jgi:hypothetical protein
MTAVEIDFVVPAMAVAQAVNFTMQPIGVDVSGDGYIDRVGYDTNGDGRINIPMAATHTVVGVPVERR